MPPDHRGMRSARIATQNIRRVMTVVSSTTRPASSTGPPISPISPNRHNRHNRHDLTPQRADLSSRPGDLLEFG